MKVTDSGWTDDKTAVEWFRDVFVPQATLRNTSGKPILLTFDGHHSHETPEMLSAAFEHNILLYCLPSKTTHKLQPLDVGVFGPLQTAWSKHAQRRAAERHPVTRDTVVHEYMKVRHIYMTPKAICSAFRRSGMWPINPNVFDAQDYGPSLHSSINPAGPSGAPNLVPSSPSSAKMTDGADTSLVDESYVATEAESDGDGEGEGDGDGEGEGSGEGEDEGDGDEPHAPSRVPGSDMGEPSTPRHAGAGSVSCPPAA